MSSELGTTREQRMEFCGVCKNRGFDPKHGIICGLTSAPADFEVSCDSYVNDPKENQKIKSNKAILKQEETKRINQGRNTLFVLGGLFVLIGCYEGFIMDGHIVLAAYIDWALAAVFFGLGIWSISMPLPALATGLGVYVAIHVLNAIVDPTQLLSGILVKGFIIAYLVMGINNAYQDRKNNPKKSESSLLDDL